jgi:hypothetical protein
VEHTLFHNGFFFFFRVKDKGPPDKPRAEKVHQGYDAKQHKERETDYSPSIGRGDFRERSPGE